jgi:hypothetical protein
MILDYVRLRWASGGGQAASGSQAALREIAGADEAALAGSSTRDAVALLDRLLEAAPGTTLGPGKAAGLCAADRDRLLAAVYQRTYGQRVQSTLTCRACERPFDLDFSLPDLVAGLEESRRATPGITRGPDGVYRLPDGRGFRLPTGNDELGVEGDLVDMSPGEAEERLLERCLVGNEPADEAPAHHAPAGAARIAVSPPGATQALQDAMQQVAPVIDLDLEARCPECGTVQPVHFDLQGYLLESLLNERKRLLGEVHRLAMTYHWSRDEILGLARHERRAYLELIAADADGSPGLTGLRWSL